ncbi:putative peptidase [Roseimaritima multifibrata]|uniref:Putative peptidase n=1 Tax=Roseimaritima multifibrata TaxID=1930274 RepID=A0A517MF58_9BACT|nr:aminopeptidase P family protein [Roseimaritima multifibrata]QDS93519.1 putative peptidase [Roseimaritima multifibrata]
MNYSARLQEACSRLSSHQVDALFVFNETNVSYLTGFSGDSTVLLLTENGATLLSDRRYETQLQQECPQLPALVRGPDKNMYQLIEEAAASQLADCQSIGFEANHLHWNDYQKLAKSLGARTLVPTSAFIEAQRLIKDEDEIAILRRAVSIAERTFLSIRARLRPDWTELQMAHELESTMRELGASGCGFAPILAIDANAALPHAHPGSQVLNQASTLLVDWGAKFQGYTSDLTRTLSIGPPSDRFHEVYEVVLLAQQTAIEKIRPGIPLKEIDRAARDVIAQAGFGDYFGHGLGHGIGLQVHESPRMASTSEETLESGMVVTVEPGIYLPGEFGVRIEDDVLVTPEGNEVLSSLAKGLDDMIVFL